MADIITIDGPAASGKTSMGYHLAKAIGYQFIDSGCIYRAGTLMILRNSADYTDEVKNAEIFHSMDLKFVTSANGQKVFLENDDVTTFLDSMEVTKVVPYVAAMAKVREAVREIQRRIVLTANSVVTGRDIGTVVFPNARLKIFITATAEARANRRFLQLQSEGEFVTYEAILEDIKNRDQMDSTRAESPFKMPAGAIVLDTTSIDMPQTEAALLKIVTDNHPR